MVSAPNSAANDLGSSPGQGHCVVFLGKTLFPYSASLHLGHEWVLAILMLEGRRAMD